MADADKSKPKDEKGILHRVDPAIEAKVDKMMNPIPEGGRAKEASSAGSASSAPLLPDEKLPNFDRKSPRDNHTEIRKPEPNKPRVISEIQSNNTIPKPKEPSSDPETDKAVDEIAEEESDRILAIEDAKAQLLAEGSAEIDRGFFNRVKSKIVGFWHNPKARNSVITAVLLAIVIVGAIPASRYFTLNFLGVRASASIRVVDDKTNQPLKNVEVSIDGKSNKTDIDGRVKLEKLRLGSQQMTVKKPAFADANQKITIGWGSNPKGDVGLRAVGSRYTFEVKDFISGQPVKSVEAISGEASATANENGEIVLVVADQAEPNVNIQIVASNYRTENINLEVGNKDIHRISLVPAKKHAFVSKRSGKYDLYKVDVDGKNEERVLAGTGAENEDSTVILPSPKSNVIAYVTTTGDRHNEDGFALSSLMIINLENNKIQKIDESERIQLIDFIGSKLVYVKIAEGQSATSLNRHRLVSYDIETKQPKELVKTNYFNDVLIARGAIYYAPAAYKASGGVGLFKINADGSNKSTVYDKEAWNLFRVSYDKIDITVGQTWFQYDTGSNLLNALSGPPAAPKSRIYADSPDGRKSAWVDDRDGKGVLIIYDPSTGQENVLQTQSGLSNPINWLDNDHLVYRVATSSETADYAISISGGEPKKIKDVTNTAGLDRWYYY